MNRISYRFSFSLSDDLKAKTPILRVERVDMNKGQVDFVAIGPKSAEELLLAPATGEEHGRHAFVQLHMMLDHAIRELMHPDEEGVPSLRQMILLGEKTADD